MARWSHFTPEQRKAHRAEYMRAYKERYRTEKRTPAIRPKIRQTAREQREKDARARLAEIPPDTRDLTQSFLGDPIPQDPRRGRYG